ncbi:alpha-amylase/4-alpha-glucanotransferase domain-containing protein [Nitrosovibrio tenuis]|uniref:Alpha-amylase n=1 Tax=Nitrosovibrio tenuis TaxID=1233 RepID=A0A1H7H4B7_9PROT|nr:alpha-amylase/4-alpha-glucanotransferase domain-containing protein [Nitrosovibrio tenuis]SEK45161.1 alpha-amylase [Nitrosovibrio tenuis]
MSQPVSLLFGVHAHQPVGNFPEVLADAHLRCYKPFLQVVYRYPKFCFALHISGWLLDYLLHHYPEDMLLLREMVARGQVELFGAGETEPVLAAIPNRDRIGQIQTFSDKLEMELGQRPQGAWLTERVWEATVVPALADCGIRYVIVDDYHFLCAGKTAAELDGYFTTEEDGRVLDLFPISETLRYRLPFSPADEVVAYIESFAKSNVAGGRNAAIYFDDIEKFGIWPETYQWVYERGWLDQFIQGILSSSMIRTQHYRDYHSIEKTRGVVYLPTTSYIEMNEWTLPAQPAHIYADLVRQAKSAGWYESHKAFLRGGIWKNFFSRYPESNWMHKRMLGLSARLDSLPVSQHTSRMKEKLYESQANDAYWHGLFGGLYLPHLRRAIYKAIVELEAMLDACAPRAARFIEDTDLDGTDEMYLQNGLIQAVLKLDGDGGICEFDSYLLNHNFGDTLRRQTEHYYHKIRHSESSGHSGTGIASAHERISFKHKIDVEDMEVDGDARGLFIDRLNGDTVDYRHEPFTASGPYCHAEVFSLQISKSFDLVDSRLQVSYRFAADVEGVFSTEINLAMPSCDGWSGRYVYRGGIPGGFGQLLELRDVVDIALDDDELQGSVELKVSSPASLRAQPYYSVSQSEAGFEKIMQAVTLKLEWPVTMDELLVSLEIKAKGGTLKEGSS